MIKVWKSQRATDLNLYSYLDDWYSISNIKSMPYPCPFGLGIEEGTDKFLIQTDGILWFLNNFSIDTKAIDLNF